MAATSPTPRRGHRASAVPGFFTRRQVAQIVGVSSGELDTFERAGVFVASQRRERGDTRPVLYDAVDVGLARFAVTAHRFGVRGESLRALCERVRGKRKRLLPGWVGYVVCEIDGDVELLPAGSSVDGLLASYAQHPSVLCIWLEVPAFDDGGPR